ncbi:MAG: hypothetical protein ACRDRL_26430, partial [Sciscionella sp.]
MNRAVQPVPVISGLDPESAEWLRTLAGASPGRDAALARLHGMLVRIALAEARRRGPRLRIAGPELEDLAYQAAADALLGITAKLSQFRGESRFTTWAYKFVIFEISAKLGRHFWRHPSVPLDAEDWDRLPDRFGFEPEREAEWGDRLAALRHASANHSAVGNEYVVTTSRRPGAADRIRLRRRKAADEVHVTTHSTLPHARQLSCPGIRLGGVRGRGGPRLRVRL